MPAGGQGATRASVGLWKAWREQLIADRPGNRVVFNIGGNTARLIAAVHYNRQKVYIRAVLTHEEYDAGRWKE